MTCETIRLGFDFQCGYLVDWCFGGKTPNFSFHKSKMRIHLVELFKKINETYSRNRASYSLTDFQNQFHSTELSGKMTQYS